MGQQGVQRGVAVRKLYLRAAVSVACAYWLAGMAGCQGGGIGYAPDAATADAGQGSAAAADGAAGSAPKGPPLPVDVTAPVAPADYKTTDTQAKTWSQKLKSGENFNEVLIQASVVKAAPHQAEQVRIEPGKLCFPIQGNENLLKLKPGAPFIGPPASDSNRRAGKSNNVLGFLRKVKEVKQENGEIVVHTEPAHLEDVIVGAAALQFPPGAQALDIGDEVQINDIVKDMPPSFEELNPEAKPKSWTKKRGAWDIEGKFGYGFLNEFKADLLQLKELIELGDFEADLDGSAYIAAVADFFVGAILKVSIEMTWTNPLPHATYIYAAVGGKAELSLQADIDATFTITKSLEPEQDKKDDDKTKEKKKGNSKRQLTKNPVKKPAGGKATKPGGKADKASKFKFGEPKYYKGPVIYGIPTTFVFTLTGKCDFTLYGELKAHAVAKVAYDAMYGVEYKDGNWGTIEPNGFEKDFGWKVDKAEGGAEVQCEIGPRIDWLFADVAGPFIEAKGMLHAGAKFESVCPDPGTIEQEKPATGKISAFVDIGIKATVGFSVDLVIWSTEFSEDLLEQWWTLWSNWWPIDFGFGMCPTTCHDGIQNGYETGMDCGGQSGIGACVPCDYGQPCVNNKDCNFGTKVTCQGGKCNNLNCVTGQQEAYMTDVNCGGVCASAGYGCKVGQKCNVNADCESENCVFGKCDKQKCDNGVHDWWEMDVDCGGQYCGPCGPGHGCKNDGDCTSGYVCRGGWATASPGFAIGACVPQSCDLDQWWNTSGWGQKPGMTDVMCGGACARVLDYLDPKACHYGKDNLLIDKTCGLETVKCKDGKKCEQDGDCLSNACYEGKCVVLANNDGVQQYWETDVDCGGKNPYHCKIGKGCKSSVDCEYSAPCAKASVGDGKVCSLCEANGKLDGWESDVDCGSQCIEGKASFELCKLGQKCNSSADCAVGYTANWQGKDIVVDAPACTFGKCAPACLNGVWDEKSEADVDCGGKCAAKCGKDKNCKYAADCESGACIGGKCLSKCFNGKLDEGEGGIDCAGNCANKCLKGMTCGQDGDCTTGQCIKGICGFDTCKDGKISGNETDIDCGGGCDKKCEVKLGCKADKDCVSGFCDGKACVASGCEDLKKTLGETDTDCGGTCAPASKCALSKLCKQGGDCQSGICSTLGQCVDSACKDGLKSAGETDIDCGGGCPNKCTTGKGCGGAKDCDSGYCDGTVCVGDFCSDKVLSAGESDLDCGGACTKKCTSGKKCGSGADCQSSYCKLDGTCAAGACEDGKKSPGEADVDCGGNCSTPCLVGKACKGGVDCATNLCAAVSLACVATTCQDEIKDAGETDIDCGGGCKACALSKGCSVNADCQSGWCDGQKCVASHCQDNQKDADETDSDCGGSDCGGNCAVSKGCGGDKDCQSGYCDAVGKACVASQCADNHLDKGETDIDCGGVCQSSKACADKQGCAVGKDCASGVCSKSGKCVATTCFDEVLTADETGIDCGGACAQKCTSGQGCKGNGDCDAGFCSAKLLCVGGACEDGKLSAGETDIDCGGNCTAKCATAQGCKADTDCQSTYCDGSTCQATSCTDKKKDSTETDVDCGGPCGQKCADSKGCAKDGDCNSAVCAKKSLVCVSTTCTDEIKSGNETDTDCGGSCAAKCASAKGCKANGDCQSGYCDGAACVDDPCVDKQKDQGESDVDCGNVCAAKCLVGKGCALATDCSSTFCDGTACVDSACKDKKADFGETDTDCGGPCSPCAAGKQCLAGSDCGSGLCAVVSAVCVTNTCADETKDAGETDVDCGGACGQKCVVGKGCASNGDCASGYCDGQVCVADHCLDKQKDAGETGKDCGGSCSAACDNGDGCKLSTDCTSTYCAAVSLACVATPCLNEVKDGTETDIDCGGGVCSGKCAAGKGCAAGSDCASGFCNTGTGKCVATSCEDGVKSGDELGPDCGGACPGCKDGVACTKDTDCVSGLCATLYGGAKTCGCPPYTKLQKITAAGKTATCAPNFFFLPESFCSPIGDGSVLQCNNNGFQITKNYLGLNGGYTYDLAKSVCDGLTWGGFDDWRVATIGELTSLFQWQEQNSSLPSKPITPMTYPININTTMFAVWSGTTISPPFPGYQDSFSGYLQPNSPLIIDTWAWTKILPLNPGAVSPANIPSNNKQDMIYYCARWPYDTAPTLPNPRFEIIHNGQTVLDHWTNRWWYRNKAYKTNGWKAAMDFCASLNVGGYGGWTLPTMPQLLTIIDLNRATPPYWDTDLFPAVEAPAPSNIYAGETFLTTSPLCNGTKLDGSYGCPYQLAPYSMATQGGAVSSALCVHW